MYRAWTNDIEEAALKQIENVSNLPFIHHHVAIMPDVHAGCGCVVGSVIPTYKAIIPAAVGVDIGCGMAAVKTDLKAKDLPDSLRQIRLDIEEVIPVGFNIRKTVHEFATGKYFYTHIGETFEKYKIKYDEKPRLQLGTLGGGNHFIEICIDENQDVWVMLHSGSRGIGNLIGSVFIEKAKEEMARWFIHLPDTDLAYLPEGSKHFDAYIKCMNWAQEYAKLNREVMLEEIKTVLLKHFTRVEFLEEAINCHHNYCELENHYGKNIWVTRKGAVRARETDLGIIPGSMGTKSYIVKGRGNVESFSSCSHGAGRRMSRADAKRTFSIEDHAKYTEGVECRKDIGVLDETPGAYKDIDQVMENQKDLVYIVHTLKQVMCIKG